MTELLGYAGTAEIPCVIIDAQRGGPSTGLPTKTEQSDLQHALYGGHGEAPRVVIAPITVEDCFWSTIDAFNYSERFQVPVILLTDQGLATRMEVIHKPDTSQGRAVGAQDLRRASTGDYKRYALHRRLGLADGHPRARRAASTWPPASSTTSSATRATRPRSTSAMQTKRWAKLAPLRNGARPPRALRRRAAGDRGHRLRLHLRARARGGRPRARAEGLSVGAFYPRVLGPVPGREGRASSRPTRPRVLVPEVNFTGQLARLVRAECGLQVESHAKCDGLPFTAEDIHDIISERITS